MTAKQKKHLLCAAAGLAAAAVPFVMYFGARTLSDVRFDAVLDRAASPKLQHTEALRHFNGLDPRTQQLYSVLREAMEARDTETARVAFVPTAEEFAAAFDAVLLDNPLFCDLVREECRLSTTDYSAAVSLTYLESGDARRTALARTADEMLRRVSVMDEDTAALQLHDALAKACVYTDTGSLGNAYDALVCCASDSRGYALAYALLCREAGIDCAVVTGTAASGDTVGAHAWNVLTLDGVTGYTDVSWNDTDLAAADLSIPLHGYYFLSGNEIAGDHTAEHDPVPTAVGDTQNYYEQRQLTAASADEVRRLLSALLSEARRTGAEFVEFRYDPMGTDIAAEIASAIEAVNAEDTAHPRLRSEYKCYPASASGGMTVQLFYEKQE